MRYHDVEKKYAVALLRRRTLVLCQKQISRRAGTSNDIPLWDDNYLPLSVIPSSGTTLLNYKPVVAVSHNPDGDVWVTHQNSPLEVMDFENRGHCPPRFKAGRASPPVSVLADGCGTDRLECCNELVGHHSNSADKFVQSQFHRRATMPENKMLFVVKLSQYVQDFKSFVVGWGYNIHLC